VAALPHAAALHQSPAIAGTMQLDEAVAHRAVDEKIAHELHAAMLTEKKRAPKAPVDCVACVS